MYGSFGPIHFAVRLLCLILIAAPISTDNAVWWSVSAPLRLAASVRTSPREIENIDARRSIVSGVNRVCADLCRPQHVLRRRAGPDAWIAGGSTGVFVDNAAP